MNLFEAGIIPAGLAGGIIGWVLGEPSGTLWTVGGMLAGGAAGMLAGWLYGLLVIALMIFFGALWGATRGRSTPEPKSIEGLARPGALGIVVGVVASSGTGFFVGWHLGLLVALSAAVVTAFLSVLQAELK